MQPPADNDKNHRVQRLLNANRPEQPEGFWSWMSRLDGRPADKKSANKFLLACILDYQMRYEIVWENARRYSEDDLGDPDDLWDVITKIPQPVWDTEAYWRKLGLHRLPQAHKRVWKIGDNIVEQYQGDARNIWIGQSPLTVVERLERIGAGPQISRVTAGGLIDTNQISGGGPLKSDIHVQRVLGRVYKGDRASVSEAHRIAEGIEPGNTWRLDFPLFQLGRQVCKPRPECGKCYLRPECVYARRNGYG